MPGTGPGIPSEWPPLEKRYQAQIIQTKWPLRDGAIGRSIGRSILRPRDRYYYTHVEQRRAYERQRGQSEHRRAWRAQHRAKKREAAALARKRERWRTAEKIKALGPLKLTIALEDYLKPVNTPVETYLHTFCQSLEADDRPQPSFCELLDDSYTLTDMDSGEHRPLDRPVWDQWLDDLLEDLSEDNISDLPSDDLSTDHVL